MQNKPYLTKTLNYIAANEIITLLLIVTTATLSHVSTNDAMKLSLSLIILLLNLQFLVFSLKIIILYNFENLSKFKCFDFLYFIAFFKRLACKFNILIAQY